MFIILQISFTTRTVLKIGEYHLGILLENVRALLKSKVVMLKICSKNQY